MVDPTKDVFGDDKDPADTSDIDNAQPNQEPSNDPFVDQLRGIIREDGTQKFTDVASALDSIPHQDKHISTIEGENAGLKEDLAREKAAKEVLQKAANSKEPGQPALTETEIGDIFDQRTTAREEANQQEVNVNSVRNAFSSQFGDKASDEMDRVAADSGMTKTQLKELSAKSPQAVLQLAGIKVEAAPVQKTPYSHGNDQPRPQPKPEEAKSVMGGADTKQMVAAWRGAGERMKQT